MPSVRYLPGLEKRLYLEIRRDIDKIRPMVFPARIFYHEGDDISVGEFPFPEFLGRSWRLFQITVFTDFTAPGIGKIAILAPQIHQLEPWGQFSALIGKALDFMGVGESGQILGENSHGFFWIAQGITEVRMVEVIGGRQDPKLWIGRRAGGWQLP